MFYHVYPFNAIILQNKLYLIIVNMQMEFLWPKSFFSNIWDLYLSLCASVSLSLSLLFYFSERGSYLFPLDQIFHSQGINEPYGRGYFLRHFGLPIISLPNTSEDKIWFLKILLWLRNSWKTIYSLDLNSSLVNESLPIKWRFKYTEDFGYLEETCNQFIGWVSTSLVTLRVRHDWSDLAAAAAATQPMCGCGYLYTVFY